MGASPPPRPSLRARRENFVSALARLWVTWKIPKGARPDVPEGNVNGTCTPDPPQTGAKLRRAYGVLAYPHLLPVCLNLPLPAGRTTSCLGECLIHDAIESGE